jgi:hypothetical protein
MNDLLFTASISGADELANIVLEGSTNGRDFFKIDNVNYSETSNTQNLTYTLNGNTPYTYFRLMMVDRDNKASYSAVRRINVIKGPVKMKLAGNPVTTQIRLYASTTRRENVEVQLINAAGQILQRQKFNVSAGTSLLQLPVDRIPAGMYFLRTQIGDNYVESFRVVKQ